MMTGAGQATRSVTSRDLVTAVIEKVVSIARPGP